MLYFFKSIRHADYPAGIHQVEYLAYVTLCIRLYISETISYSKTYFSYYNIRIYCTLPVVPVKIKLYVETTD